MSAFKVGDRAAIAEDLSSLGLPQHQKGTIINYSKIGDHEPTFEWESDVTGNTTWLWASRLYKITDVPPVPVEKDADREEFWREIALLQGKVDELQNLFAKIEQQWEAPLPPVPAPSRQPAQGEVWRHIETDVHYLVLQLGNQKEGDRHWYPSVVYRPWDENTIWYTRRLDSFVEAFAFSSDTRGYLPERLK